MKDYYLAPYKSRMEQQSWSKHKDLVFLTEGLMCRPHALPFVRVSKESCLTVREVILLSSICLSGASMWQALFQQR